MDPLSLSVAILTILGSGGSVASALRQVTSKNAPDALLALSNEVSDLHLIVLEISQLLQEHHENTLVHLRTERLLTSLGSMLGRGKGKLLELESLIQYKLTTPAGPSGEAKLNRLAWVREEKHVHDIKEEIRSIKVSLAAMIGILAAKTTLRIEFQVAELRLINQEFQNQEGAAQVILRQENTERAMSGIIGGQTRIERILNELLASHNARQVFEAPVSTTRNTSGQEREYPARWGLQILSVRQRQNTTCTPGCTCSCHHRSTWRSPQALRTILGLLFVGYTGLPLLGPKCDNQNCLEISGPAIYIKYYFPAWFTAHALEMYAQTSKPDGLTQNLRVLQIVWFDAKIFRLCRAGDVGGLKLLLASRTCSPNVVGCFEYETPLEQAVRCGKAEICKVLLHAGADPYSENINRRTPYESVWMAILGKAVSPVIMDKFRALFSDPNLESYQFNSIHKTVLGLHSVSLEEILRQSSSLIDAVDVDGRTALSWCSQRGDLRALKVLLHRGADFSKADRAQNDPLSYAVRSGSRPCVQLLLEYGANINIVNRNGVSPLHRLALRWDDVEMLQEFVSRQANINAIDNFSQSILLSSISFNTHKVSVRLIELGANIHYETPDGSSALSYAVENNNHPVLKLLLQRGVDHVGEIYEYGSFLHLVAEYADLESLRLLTNARLATRDIYYKRSDGLTALDIARKRSGRDLQLFNAFMEFVGSVDPVAISAGLHSVSDSEEDEFEDAVERQA